MDFEIFSPGTIGNFGSGFDILGACLEGIGDRFTFQQADAYRISIKGLDASLIPTDIASNTVTIAARKLYELTGHDKPFEVTIHRELPSSGGLGSSAASSVAGAMAAAKFCGLERDFPLIIEAALTAEASVSGRHLDNILPCLFGGICLQKAPDSLEYYQIPLGMDLQTILILPNTKIKTADSRLALPPHLLQSEWIKEMASCSLLISGILQGDRKQISSALDSPYSERYRHHLLPGFSQLKSQLLDRDDVYGFSLSGAGPTCFALVNEDCDFQAIKDKAYQAFGQNTKFIRSKVSQQGARFL
ncbi:MAG: homoserine kinase [Pseudobacteriovorax sp.]|nr:homoserine kinase [Pseudobacteriovorax sp.]